MIKTDKNEVYRYLGFRGTAPDAGVAALVDRCLEELQEAVTPRWVCREFPIETVDETAAQETAAHGTAAPGTEAYETAAQETAVHGTAAPGTEAEAYEAAAHGTAAHGTEAYEMAAQDTAVHGTAAHGTAAHEATVDGTAAHETASGPWASASGAFPPAGTPGIPVIRIAGMEIRSSSLSRNLRGCESVCLMGATLGLGPDRLIARASVSQMSRAVVLQAAASAMIESWCDEVNREIIARMKEKGYSCRPRFSPGYGDFLLDHQKDFAQILRLQKSIGVSLTESLLMMPSKSVTAVIGLSRGEAVCVLHGCEECDRARSCAFSRIG